MGLVASLDGLPEGIEVVEGRRGVLAVRPEDHEAIVAAGFGAKGILLEDPAKTDAAFAEARAAHARGQPVLLNAQIGRSDFRKGSLSM